MDNWRESITRTGLLSAAAAIFFLTAKPVYAIQLHTSSEGIITHQLGHLFFLFSMVILVFIIKGKELDREKGWRFIQLSAFFFMLWNLTTISAHFLDNQIHIVEIENISAGTIRVITQNNSRLLAWIYYALKLDHLLCVPAMIFLYNGLTKLAEREKRIRAEREI